MLEKEIKRLRTAKGYTQEQLATLVPMTQHGLCQIEKGKRKPSLELYERIMKVLDVRPTLNIQDDELYKNVFLKRTSYDLKQLQEEFSNWMVMHTGGNNFLLSKNFKTLSNQDVLVSVSPDAALVYKKIQEDEKEQYGVKVLNDYAEETEWKKKKEKYLEFEDLSAVILYLPSNDGYQVEEIAEELFTKQQLHEMMEISFYI